MESTFPVGVGANHGFSTSSPDPDDLMAYFQQVPVEFTMEDLLRDGSGTGHTTPDPPSSGDTSNHYSTAAGLMEVSAAAAQGQAVPVPHAQLAVGPVAGPTAATGAEILHLQGWPGINPGLSPIQQGPLYSAAGDTGTGTAEEETMLQSPISALPGFDSNNATHSPAAAAAAAAEDLLPVVNAGYSSCPSTTTTTGTGTPSSPDQEVNAGAGHPSLSGGGALTEPPLWSSLLKRKKLASGSSSQRPTPESDLVESEAGLIQSDAISTDIKPPDGSTPLEIIRFLKREACKALRDGEYGKKVNPCLAEDDQNAPKAVRSYVTTVEMMTDHKTHRGYWKEKQVETVRDESQSLWYVMGLKRTFQFHTYDGTKTNWFMDEYIPTVYWGMDLYIERRRFRVVYQSVEVPGVPTSRQVIAVKHRMRGPEDPKVVKGESEAWNHFIKIYDRHPELPGSKVVYAVCCYCPGVLRAGTENGTNSLSTHWKRTCKSKHLQALLIQSAGGSGVPGCPTK